MRVTEDVQILLDAVALGSIYALMAIGIGLVFGVLRLVNFAYGQLIMAGGYAIALTSDRSPVVSIAVCLAVVLTLSLAMELVAFRPLRRASASPTTMLVATFAISYLLQSIALVKFGAIGKFAVLFPGLAGFVTVGGVSVRWITFVVDRGGRGRLRRARAPPREDDDRAPDARCVDRLRRPRACSGCGRIASSRSPCSSRDCWPPSLP